MKFLKLIAATLLLLVPLAIAAQAPIASFYNDITQASAVLVW